MSKLLLADTAAAALVVRAGWRGEDAVTALAISFAEDIDWTDRPEFRIDAHQLGDVHLEDSVWGPSVGCMQIRSLRADKGTGRLRDELANMDPGTNYGHAHALWLAEGWHPWSTFNSGSYRGHLHRAAAAIGEVHAVFTLTRYLFWRPGMRQSDGTMLHGSDVRFVQEHCGADPDSWYGPDTEAHVRAFQRSHGLAQDGIVGPDTIHKMDPAAAWAPR